MANKILIPLLILLCVSCTYRQEFPTSDFCYPESRVWAHSTTDTNIAKQKEPLFDGLELDVNYSEYQDKIFMGHELIDTLNCITLDQWFAALKDPKSKYFWVDMKNLDKHNAQRIADIILEQAEKYDIKDQLMVEHTDHRALKQLKDRGLHVILWVENSYWTGLRDRAWVRITSRHIHYLHPDALSCEYVMFPLLNHSFPNQNIHYWDTPREYNDTNVAHTRMLLQDPAVKVVLVDYPNPIE